jgi:hypothetical protein
MAVPAKVTALDVVFSILLRIGEGVAFVVAGVDLFTQRDHVVFDLILVFFVAVLLQGEG